MNAVTVMQGWVDALVHPLGESLARGLFGALGVVVLLLVIAGALRHRIGVYRSTLGLLGATVLLALANDLALFSQIDRITFLERIRLVMGVVSFMVLLVTFESVRRSHLQERYALLWVSTGVIILLCAVFTRVLDFFCALLGMQYVTFVVAVIFTFLLLVAFHFSIALSALTDDRSRLAQRCSQLQARLDQLERQRKDAAGSPDTSRR